jgi:RNA polymerase sigma-70 factor, ECF subfamily
VRDPTPSERSLERFRKLHDQTARPLWRYLARCSGDPALADDLLQESYMRLLATETQDLEEAHMRNLLFRIATNLLRDHWRHEVRCAAAPLDQEPARRDGTKLETRVDLSRLLEELVPRDRQLLWLAYAEGSSHREIAEAVGLREASIRPMLFRARERFASLLRRGGWEHAEEKRTR